MLTLILNPTMKRLILFNLILLALLAGCKNESPAPQTQGKIRVTTAKATRVAGAHEFRYSGTVEAVQTIPLTFQTTGTVQQVLVEAGDAVRKGQLLATLDDSDLKNILATTRARYDQARDAYDRLKQVHDEGSLPEIKWVEMKTNLEQAKAALDIAQNNLGKCRLTAPADGFVGRRNIEPGQSSLSLTGAPIELVRIEKVLVKVAVPENEINRIAKGKRASFTVMALNDARYEGTVTTISPVAELISRTYTARITVDNPRLELKPGMVCDVSLAPPAGDSALVVPGQAVGLDAEGRNYVFVVDPLRSTVKKQVVRTGRYNGAGIEITGGLGEGTVVVTAGMEKLTDNTAIQL